MFVRARVLILVLLVASVSCARREDVDPSDVKSKPVSPPREIVAVELRSPAGPGSGEPFLTTAMDGRVYLSWLEGDRETKQYALKYASFGNGAWSAPRTVVERNDFFVNWADFPSIAIGTDGRIYAHWLQKSGKGTYAYDVRVASSPDGTTWSDSIVPHTDKTESEHGFVSLVPKKGSVAAVWLDGRNMTEGHDGHSEGTMTLRYAEIGPDGSLSRETELDPRVCECCQTAMTPTSNGAVVAYRDRSEDEIRDIGYVTLRDGKWSAPQIVHRDGWKIEGCPVNGPQLDSRGDDVVVAWYTGAAEKGRVLVAFSSDGGQTFAAPIVADDGAPVGRVDVLMLPDKSAQLTWIERTGETAEVRTRRVTRDGKAGKAMKIAQSTPARAAGFPRTTLAGDEIFFAWTDVSDPPVVRVSKSRIEGSR